MSNSPCLAAIVLCVTPALAAAQEPRFAYPPPDSGAYRVVKNVQYGTSATGPMRIDVYQPASDGVKSTLIFFNTGTDRRSDPYYIAWAQVAASRGLTAILPDLGMETAADDFASLQRFLGTQEAERLQVDRNAIAVYAGSGNVSRALPVVQDPKQTGVKSAAIFYGAANVSTFRKDLPILFVRAGLDRPPVNKAMADLASAAVSQNAPVTLLNHMTGYHGFEIFNDDDATRAVIDATIDFVKRTTSAGYQTALRNGLLEATAAGQVATGNFKEAAATYASLVTERPDDARLALSHGEALLGAGEFAAACAAFEKLKGKRLGPRDLGIPAARACLAKGDPDAAIAWIRSIPEQFRRGLDQNPAFESLRAREDFQALFPKR